MGSGVKTAVFGVQWGACPLPESPDLAVVDVPAPTSVVVSGQTTTQLHSGGCG